VVIALDRHQHEAYAAYETECSSVLVCDGADEVAAGLQGVAACCLGLLRVANAGDVAVGHAMLGSCQSWSAGLCSGEHGGRNSSGTCEGASLRAQGTASAGQPRHMTGEIPLICPQLRPSCVMPSRRPRRGHPLDVSAYYPNVAAEAIPARLSRASSGQNRCDSALIDGRRTPHHTT
jgi:hypothetical protein